MSFVDDMKKLDVNNIGTWPVVFKGIAIGMVCLMVLGIGIYFDTLGQVNILTQAQNKEAELKKTFEEKQAKAVSLTAYKKQMEDMQNVFGAKTDAHMSISCCRYRLQMMASLIAYFSKVSGRSQSKTSIFFL